MSLSWRIAEDFARSHPLEASGKLESAPDAEARAMVDVFEPATTAAVLAMMTPLAGARVLRIVATERASAILDGLSLDRASELVRCLPSSFRQGILGACRDARRKELESRLRYPEQTAGALMEPRVASFHLDTTVEDVLARLHRPGSELRYYVYVVNENQKLEGVTTLRDVAAAQAGTSLRSLMSRPVEQLSARTSKGAIATHPGWSRFSSLPVVDESGRLTGVMRYETFRRLSSETATSEEESTLGVVLALGELFWLSASNLLDGFPRESSQPEPRQ